jgi:hypothetical protein
VFTFRPTARLAKRLGIPSQPDHLRPTTTLGDWYANVIHLRPRHVVLCISETSLLPVVLSGQGLRKTMLSDFRTGVSGVLAAIGVDTFDISTELEEMRRFIVGKPLSRSVLGSMNDLAWGLECRLEADPEISLKDLALELAETPCGPLKYASPIEATRALFSGKTAS